MMGNGKYSRGFSLLEITIATSIFTMVLVGTFTAIDGMRKTLEFETRLDAVASGSTLLMDEIGADIRESSYAYIYAGDWYSYRDPAGAVNIMVARNYFSASPFLGGNTLVPGISNEGWGQCPNPSFSWSNSLNAAGVNPLYPKTFLTSPIRNNVQMKAPVYPPPTLTYSIQDAKGRLFSFLPPGENCTSCGSVLESEAFISGVLLFSPRKEDGSFSYVDGANEPQWESMIFYCPYRRSAGVCEMRKYVFYASSLAVNASLADFMDFNGNGIIESPPMTDANDDFVLDGDGEVFFMNIKATGRNSMVYYRWDNTTSRYFQIEVSRDTGIANIYISGGPFGSIGSQQVQLDMHTYAMGLSDFDVSSFINNPSWVSGGAVVNPAGVMELGTVRVTLQTDRSKRRDQRRMETTQSTMFRPRN